MKCPACGAEGAYVGLSTVECQDRSCRHAVPAKGGALVVGDLHVVGGYATRLEELHAKIDEFLAKVRLRMVVWKKPIFLDEEPGSVTITVPKPRGPVEFVLHRSRASAPATVSRYSFDPEFFLRPPGD